MFARLPRGWRTLAAACLAAGLLAGCASSDSMSPGDPIGKSELGAYLAARQAERERNFNSAAQFMLAALERDPNNYDMLVRAQTFLVLDGRFDDAAKLAQRTLQVAPGHPQSVLLLALADVRQKDFAGAEKLLADQPLASINRIVLPLINGWVQAAQDRPAAALNALRPILEVNGFRPLYEYHAALMTDYFGRRSEADEHYQKSLEIQGGAPARLIEAAGNYYERTGRPELARDLYAKFQGDNRLSATIAAAVQRVADHAPPPPPLVPTPTAGIAEALFNVAGALREDNNDLTALIYGRLALAVEPQMPVDLLLVADILDSGGQRQQANAVYAQIPASSPLSWPARIRIAENLRALGKNDEAKAMLNKMADEKPDRIEPLVALGQILRAEERYPEAVEVYDRAIARVPPNEPRYWSLYYTRGIALERSHQWPRAEADFKHALQLEPDQPDVLNYLAYSWVDQGLKDHYNEATRMLERAVALRPNNGAIVDSLGWVLFRTGRYKEAVTTLEHAVELEPEDPTLLNHLGDAYWQVGREAEARFQWQRALHNGPEPDLKAEIERKLDHGPAVRPAQGS
ncbi:MAG TPA: tetratricopeptide repeat protein [Alphaproteobacteria bacterium]|nr:tetratricopeptide repeat protein [Alphaproteobacteria bacterium]